MAAADLTPEQRRARAQGHAALVVVQLFFGLFPIFGKWAFEDFSPLAVAAWRVGFGGVALLAVALLFYGRRAVPRRGDWLRFSACALTGVVFNMGLYLVGLERSTAVNAGLIMPLIPVFTFAVAALMRQERFDAARGGGILLALCGALVLLFHRGPDLSSRMLSGNLLMVVNAFSYSWFLVLARPLLARYPPLVVIAWVFALSMASLPLFLLGAPPVPAGVSTRGWLSLAFILVFPTVLAYLLNTFALARVSASTTAVYIFLQPLITVTAGVFILREPLWRGTILAGALTLAGVWLVARRPVALPIGPDAPRPGVRRA